MRNPVYCFTRWGKLDFVVRMRGSRPAGNRLVRAKDPKSVKKTLPAVAPREGSGGGRRGLRYGLAAAACALAVFVAYSEAAMAWPEVVAPGYFISRGGLLYRDVIFPHPPALMLLIAVVGKVFGFSAWSLRGLIAVPMAVTAALVVLNTRREAFFVSSLLGMSVSILWALYMDGLAVWPDPFVAPIVLGGGLLLERYQRSRSRRDLVVAALLLGLCFLFKQTTVWVALAGMVWVLIRTRSLLETVRYAGWAAAPGIAFVVGWGAVFRTMAHVDWTIRFVLFSPLRTEIAQIPVWDDIHEIIPVFLIALTGLLLPVALRRRVSPLVFLAVGVIPMGYPRTGLLHSTAVIGLAAMLTSRATSEAVELFSVQETFPKARLAAAAVGMAAAITALAVAFVNGGATLLDGYHGRLRYWDDGLTEYLTQGVRSRVSRGGTVYLYDLHRDNVYIRTGSTPPGGFFVNSSLWYLFTPGVDERSVDALSGCHCPVLFHVTGTADGRNGVARLQGTRIYRFVSRLPTRGTLDASYLWKQTP